jgi:ATP-dependent exoDNAse (exonuclease V), alpha subunit - helicase superfamily I member
MRTQHCRKSCCSVTFCPLVPAWATTIHKFQGMEAGFDKNDQFQHLIIDPGDIKSEQQQPGILYVATSRAKTIEHMTQETPQTKMSALYWTGGGMSINRVINGSTKKQPNKQGHNRVDCLKIEKRHKWVTYLIKQQELTITDTYNKDRLKRIKNKQEQIIYGHICHRDVAGSISTMLLNPNKKMDETQDIPLSSLIDQSPLRTEN